VPEHVVGARRLLDPGGLELGEGVDPLDGGLDVPSLVRVDRDRIPLADCGASDAKATQVVVEARAAP
jgi:hypothetical protein